ncbi:MAG: phosphatidylserine/phosphatidylglycerophosphate/cardiolipin synthase family protein [Candidatus Riflebacteria bacterium]|nr:phosphatidylserine/phosphatidylglycerophosphate/cardiolipin synthase family protein [Candidatus Riflebacteria bacterium]
MNKKLFQLLSGALFLLVFFLPEVGISVEHERFPVNDNLQRVFSEIPGGEVARIRLMNKNDESWYARWTLIESAKESIDTTYFILQNDIFGFSFLGLLKKKAEQGVKIRLMVDAKMIRQYFRLVGIDEFQDLAENANVQIRFYNSIPKSIIDFVKNGDLRYIFSSNHDKILLVDGRYVITGGRNIGADYFVQPGEEKIVYYDSDVLLEGEILGREFRTAFEDEWKMLGNRIIRADKINISDQNIKLEIARRAMQCYMEGRKYSSENENGKEIPEKHKKLIIKFNEELEEFKNISSLKNFQLWRGERARATKLLDKHSINGQKDQIGYNLFQFIRSARHEIVLQNPYVVLTKEAWEELKKASARGVKIVLHTNGPKSIDVPEALAFFSKEWAEMMREMPTLKIFMAPDNLHQLHSKTIVIDGQIALVGTYNLDPLSMIINSELMIVVNNPEFSSMMRLRILNMTESSVECKIRREHDGSITRILGPENFSTDAELRKMNLLVKLSWLRPLI